MRAMILLSALMALLAAAGCSKTSDRSDTTGPATTPPAETTTEPMPPADQTTPPSDTTTPPPPPEDTTQPPSQ